VLCTARKDIRVTLGASRSCIRAFGRLVSCGVRVEADASNRHVYFVVAALECAVVIRRFERCVK
jgi:hypothetical protein